MQTHEKCVSELLKVCSNLQNFASTTKEIVLQQKKLTADLLSALSARNEGSTSTHCESKMASYISSRKELIKRAKGLTLFLKQLLNNDSFGTSSLFHKEDNRISSAMKALRCVSVINASMFDFLVLFLPSPMPKPTFGSLVSMVIHKTSGKSIRHTKSTNELTQVDIALQSLRLGVHGDKVQSVQRRLDNLMNMIQGIEIGLDNAYIQLKDTKSCLMNIVSF